MSYAGYGRLSLVPRKPAACMSKIAGMGTIAGMSNIAGALP
ncbi:MAG TPA: hypothetical protein VNL70_10290 [Tepidisphaeraceae bacterium]|nr:hypothetical protein [Tepidisphaeraceae bacterium]